MRFDTVLVFIFVLLSIGNLSSASNNERDRISSVLIEFFQKTGGINWFNRTGWILGSDYCKDWYQIECNLEGFPVKIELKDNNLSGTIPSSFWSLSSLSHLDLSQNRLSGSIPKEISKLVNLEELSLDNNFIQGSIPEEIGSLLQLRVLHLGSNNLKGMLPTSIGNMLQLESLKVEENDFRSQIPDSLSNCVHLRVFSISSNQFWGSIPAGFIEFGNLTDFSVEDNSLSGNPLFSSKWSQLTYYGAGGNLFTGELPPNLSQWSPILNWLDFSINRLTGSLPDLPISLQAMFLNSNRFTGSIPTSWVSLVNLQQMSLDRNDLSGSLPDIFGNMSQLALMNVNFNRLSGELPPLNGISGIQYFWASNNQFTGHLPYSLCQHPNLLTLDLHSNQLIGDVPYFTSKVLRKLDLSSNFLNGTLENLKDIIVSDLNLSRNSLSGHIFSDDTGFINYNQPISVLDLSHNQFSGPCFASENVDLPYLVRYVDLSYNQFSGGIRFPVYTDQLETLILSHNQLEGYILEKMLTLEKLVTLDLSYNRIRGNVPRSFSLFERLTYFNMDFNDISGVVEIPGNLVTLNLRGNGLTASNLDFLKGKREIEQLDLSMNQITSSFPLIGEMKKLRYLDISQNSISGSIPQELCNLRALTNLNLRGNLLTGKICHFYSDISHLDISNNSFSGNSTFLEDFPSLEYLDLSNNQFEGDLNSYISYVKLTNFNCENNNFTGPAPNFQDLPDLQVLNLSHNNFTGSIPSLEGCTSIHYINLNHNSFSEASEFHLPRDVNLTSCNMNNVPLICPISWEAVQRCGATCVLGEGGLLTRSLRIRLSFEGVFDWQEFQAGLAYKLNITLSRLDLIQRSTVSSPKRQNLEYIDISISPPQLNSMNEGSAQRTIDILVMRADNLVIGKYIVLTIQSPIPTSEAFPVKANDFPVGLVVGLTIGLAIAIIATIVILGILFIRKKRSVESHQLLDFDLSKINFSAAKKSIINYQDLKKMVQVGNGGFGIVYRAHWRDIKVAVKQIRAEHINENQMTAFLREVAILQNLRSHPNVLLFIGLTVPPQKLSVVTEFCEGGSLEVYLKSHTVSEDQIMKFINGIALGMHHLHLENSQK
eukprot:TRINITY_DN3031_c0_g2_i3.p1 TRINITY_DN3031_c0_g2~~TRINITY_DN3031_c0_g2_i3.p1  ORF type:complete len:1104 (-),score=213.92 TRINITY_DN3031_c0_g2_i3:642-3953(-)